MDWGFCYRSLKPVLQLVKKKNLSAFFQSVPGMRCTICVFFCAGIVKRHSQASLLAFTLVDPSFKKNYCQEWILRNFFEHSKQLKLLFQVKIKFYWKMALSQAKFVCFLLILCCFGPFVIAFNNESGKRRKYIKLLFISLLCLDFVRQKWNLITANKRLI